MAKQPYVAKEIRTPTFRLSFPCLVEPKSIMGGAKKFYSIQMLFSKKDDIKWLTDALKEVVVAKWGEGFKLPSSFKNPKHDGDVKAEDSEAEVYRGTWVMNAKADEKDVLLFLDGQKREMKPEVFYAGCYCRAKIKLAPYDGVNGKGISVYLLGMQFVGNGDALSGAGRVNASKDDFDTIEGSEPVKTELSVDNDF